VPYSWPGKLEVLDSVGSLWSATATGSGSQDLEANSGATYVEVRFTVTSGGTNDAVDDTVYGQLTNVAVYSVDDAVVDASVVAKAVAAFLSADHGLSSDVTKIAAPGRALPDSVVFSDDWTPKQVMAWCAGFGGGDDALLAWGVQTNDLKRVYLEKQDLATVRYVIRRGSGLAAQVKGDYKGSRQKIYAVYTDDAGQAQRTDDVSDEDTISDLGGHYRRGAFSISGTVDEATALQVIDMALAEEKLPQVTTSFTVRDRVYTVTGKALPIDEVVAGGIVLVDEFRSREATLSLNDFRTQWSSFQLVGVEIDEDAGTARLIPAGDRRGFEQFLTRLAELQRAA
jgi:hypothetical protein